MTSHLTAYIALVCTSGVLNAYLLFRVLKRRYLYEDIARFFIAYSIATTIYCFGSAFGLMATSLEAVKFWTVIQYVGMPFAPPLGLLFIMKYLGQRITKAKVVAFLAIPSITLIMVITNPLHHLYYRVFEIDPLLGMPYVHQEIGIWYMVHGVFIFSCMFVAFFLVVSQWRETSGVYRMQLFSLMWSQLVPMLTAFLYLIGLTPPGIDLVPMVLWVVTLLFLWAINTSELFKIIPVAKDTIFHSIDDGVVVLDQTSRVVEFNEAFSHMFLSFSGPVYGKTIDEVWLELCKERFPLKSGTQLFTWSGRADFDLTERTFQVRVSSLRQKEEGMKGTLIIIRDITEMNRLHEKLEHQAYYDELTQVYNRRAFFEKCEELLANMNPKRHNFSVVLFDIDHFKSVNDMHGHHAGDEALVHVAQICKSVLDEDMLFARYGGEEFVCAMVGKTELEAGAVADKLRLAVESQPFTVNDNEIPVTLSGGVTTIELAGEVDIKDLSQLLNKADAALYEAKRNGRNQISSSAGQIDVRQISNRSAGNLV
ncbi:diguanylate cyclase [Aciduricibacillus chroicocephali]|uniref:Diguanylate cyclase n=1 Tax=Aciduricibacillus chroicocephali TaxID=3054939 RepID=A0ABY9KUR8_9BACI|nr:diguanylate cyclase [Bacillaceae bacterium 44XB]